MYRVKGSHSSEFSRFLFFRNDHALKPSKTLSAKNKYSITTYKSYTTAIKPGYTSFILFRKRSPCDSSLFRSGQNASRLFQHLSCIRFCWPARPVCRIQKYFPFGITPYSTVHIRKKPGNHVRFYLEIQDDPLKRPDLPINETQAVLFKNTAVNQRKLT